MEMEMEKPYWHCRSPDWQMVVAFTRKTALREKVWNKGTEHTQHGLVVDVDHSESPWVARMMLGYISN
jgi:hypothetical protein